MGFGVWGLGFRGRLADGVEESLFDFRISSSSSGVFGCAWVEPGRTALARNLRELLARTPT